MHAGAGVAYGLSFARVSLKPDNFRCCPKRDVNGHEVIQTLHVRVAHISSIWLLQQHIVAAPSANPRLLLRVLCS
jgi:hypothetical protein